MLPFRNGRARARSARASAQTRSSSLASLQLCMLLLVLCCCSARCSCSCSRSSPLLLQLLLCLQCFTLLTFSNLTRFPFHDSQVRHFSPFWRVAKIYTEKCVFFELWWLNVGLWRQNYILGVKKGTQKGSPKSLLRLNRELSC